MPEVREFIRDTKPRTNTTRGGRRARHPKTTLPHRPPGPPAADRIVGGAPAGTRPLRGWLIPRVPCSGQKRSHKGIRRLVFPHIPAKVTCARTSSTREAVCARMRRVVGVAPWGARSSSLPGYLRLSASSRALFLTFSSVWLGPAPPLAPLSSASLPLFRSGRGFFRPAYYGFTHFYPVYLHPTILRPCLELGQSSASRSQRGRFENPFLNLPPWTVGCRALW